MAPAAFASSSYSLTVTSGPRVGEDVSIEWVEMVDDANAIIHLHEPLNNVSYRFELGPVVADLAGNPVVNSSFDFAVARSTRLTESSPADGERLVSLTRESIIRFDGPVDPETVNSERAICLPTENRLRGIFAFPRRSDSPRSSTTNHSSLHRSAHRGRW